MSITTFLRKTKYLYNKVADCQGDQKKLYSLTKILPSGNKNIPHPEEQDNILANNFGNYFHEKVETIERKINYPLEEKNIELPLNYRNYKTNLEPLYSVQFFHNFENRHVKNGEKAQHQQLVESKLIKI